MTVTRVFEQRIPVVRGTNSATIVAQVPFLSGPAPEVVFLTHFDALRSALRSAPDPGLVVLAANADRVVSVARIAATADRIRGATLGRHERAEIHLAEEDIALRHLQVLVWADGGRVRYRVLDLRTGLRMRDEAGQPMHAFEADGPMLVEVGGYGVLFVPRCGPMHWPADPLAAFRALPARVCLPMAAEPPLRPARPDDTLVQLLPPLVEGCEPTGTAVGRLRLTGERGTAELTVGRAALRSGLLLGRYDRCEVGGDGGVLGHQSISRVHALIFERGREVYCADTGSTNGVWRAGERLQQPFLLEPGVELTLARPELPGAVRFRWC